MEKEHLIYDDPQRQHDMLVRIMSTNDQCMDIEDDEVVLNQRSVLCPSAVVEKSFAK